MIITCVILQFSSWVLVKEFISASVRVCCNHPYSQERSLESRCRTSSAALMILTVAAIIIFWPGMLVLINAHVNQAWKEMFAGQFQDSQQHTSPNTPAGVLYICMCSFIL